MTPVEKMIKLTDFLIEKDRELGRSLIQKREFGQLRGLVKSNIIIVKRDHKKMELNRRYPDADINMLYSFLCEIDSYLLLLGLDDEIFEEEE